MSKKKLSKEIKQRLRETSIANTKYILDTILMFTNLSVTEICKNIGVSRESFYKWKRGECLPSAKAKRRLLKIPLFKEGDRD